jgi:hypothetical protein
MCPLAQRPITKLAQARNNNNNNNNNNNEEQNVLTIRLQLSTPLTTILSFCSHSIDTVSTLAGGWEGVVQSLPQMCLTVDDREK